MIFGCDASHRAAFFRGVLQTPYIVEDVRAEFYGSACRLRLKRVDGDRHGNLRHDMLQEGREPLDLLCRRHGHEARARRLRTDVDDRRAVLDHRKRMVERLIERVPLAAV